MIIKNQVFNRGAKKIILGFLVLIINSCGVTNTNLNRCKRTTSNASMSVEFKTLPIVNTKGFVQMRFVCTVSARETGKLMYKEFGQWDELVYQKDAYWPNVVWHKADLLNDDTNYIVYTSGLESEGEKIYSAVLVFDENGNDALAMDSPVREPLINYFTTKLLKLNAGSAFSTKLNDQVFNDKRKNKI